jgi:uncharacterized protein YxeA
MKKIIILLVAVLILSLSGMTTAHQIRKYFGMVTFEGAL